MFSPVRGSVKASRSGRARASNKAERDSVSGASRQAATESRAAVRGSAERRLSATPTRRRAADLAASCSLARLCCKASRPAARASTRNTDSPTVSRRVRRAARVPASRSASRPAREASRKDRSSSARSSSPGPVNNSSARASRAPRYSAPASRSSCSQARAASPSSRWARSRSRPSSIQPAQPGPAGDQRLVGQFDGVTVQGDQPGGGEALQHTVRARRPVPESPPGIAGRRVSAVPSPGAISRSRRRRAMRACSGGELAVHLLGGGGDRAAHAARLLVRGQGQGAAAAAAPGLQQGVGEHRQRAGLVGDLVDEPGGQRTLHVQAGGGRPGR